MIMLYVIYDTLVNRELLFKKSVKLFYCLNFWIINEKSHPSLKLKRKIFFFPYCVLVFFAL